MGLRHEAQQSCKVTVHYTVVFKAVLRQNVASRNVNVTYHNWGRILGRNEDESPKSLPLAIHSHLYQRILLPLLQPYHLVT
jgi:hypothetical protein